MIGNEELRSKVTVLVGVDVGQASGVPVAGVGTAQCVMDH